MRSRVFTLGKNLLIFALSLAILSVAVFYVARLAPGDPLASYYGSRVEKLTPEARFAAEERLGLHDPIIVQYFKWLRGALRGDFGISFQYKRPVVEVIGGRIGNTLALGGIGFALTFALALLLGVFCAGHEDTFLDKLICKVGTVTGCIPEFWLSLVLILIFDIYLGLLPGSGAYSVGKADDLGDRAAHLWYYAYMIRNRMLEEIRADYVLLAKSVGLPDRKILFRHCLRNCMPTYLSIMAISVPHIIGGTYIVETVFSYPGVGTLSYESARYQDYNMLMVLTLLTGAVVILCNLVAQTVNARIDPRGRAAETEVTADVR